MLIKICGIRNTGSAQAAIDAGADFISFNFVPSSKRRIDPAQAAAILKELPQPIPCKVVGVFKDQTEGEIGKTLQLVHMDYVQLHGSETSEFCAAMPIPVIKVLSLEPDFDPKNTLSIMRAYPSVKLFLLDRKMQGQGERLDLRSVAELARHAQFLLAGGITLENVEEYLSLPGLYGLDIAGGIESGGRPAPVKIKKIIGVVRSRIE